MEMIFWQTQYLKNKKMSLSVDMKSKSNHGGDVCYSYYHRGYWCVWGWRPTEISTAAGRG